MSLPLLRLIVFIEALIAAAIWTTSHRLHEWNAVPDAEYSAMLARHGRFFIDTLLMQFAFLLGSQFGIVLVLLFLAWTQRGHIRSGSTSLKLHWIAATLVPVALLLWAALSEQPR